MRSNQNNNEPINDQTSDKDLIQFVSNGREAALNELMARYKHKLFAFIFKYVQDEDVAYDILQETFIRVYTKANSYKSQFSLSTWIHQIAVNLCRDWGRKQRIRHFVSLDSYVTPGSTQSLADIIEDPNANVENQASDRMQIELLDKEIQKLPHKLKSALILFTVEGYSQEECAEILQVTPKTVEMRVYRARKILLQNLPDIF